MTFSRKVCFTFHYVSILILCQQGLCIYRYMLYIPLCLYFNPFPEPSPGLLPSFTFHYVSILINFLKPKKVVANYFTFHYVSILIAQLLLRIPPSSAFTFHYVSILIHST